MSASSPVRQDKVTYLPNRKKNLSVRKKRTFKFGKSRLPLLLIAMVMFYLLFSFGTQFNRLYAMQRDIQTIENQVVDLQKKNNDLREQLKLVQSDAYVEQVAREKLGLVKPGESRILPVKPAQ